MPLPVIDDVFRVALEWTAIGGGDAVNVMHFTRPTGSSDELMADLESNITVAMFQCVSSDASVSKVTITPLDGSTASSEYVPESGFWHGGATSGGIPNTCIVVKWLTAQRGRSHRGRTFLPFGAEGLFSNGFFAAENIGNMQDAWDTFLAAMVTDTSSPVVASYTLIDSDLVTQFLVEEAAGTQRRRQTRIRND